METPLRHTVNDDLPHSQSKVEIGHICNWLPGSECWHITHQQRACFLKTEVPNAHPGLRGGVCEFQKENKGAALLASYKPLL